MVGQSQASKSLGTGPSSVADRIAPVIVAIFIGYSAADLTILSVRDNLLPSKPQNVNLTNKVPQSTSMQDSKGALQSIVSRNIFSQDGSIPEPLSAKGTKEKPGQEAEPIASQLPLGLLGTVVHSNPAKSIAEIELKTKATAIAVRVGRDIENIANLVKVERNRIVIRNLNTSALEFIEIKTSDKKVQFNANVAPVRKGPSEIKQVAPNKFKLSRSTITKHTQDLGKLVMQASTVPRKKPSGEIDCYILTSFQPDSIFADLGVQQGDCIKSVNGESIDSPAKAMQLYQALKSANTVKIIVESDGHDVEKEYSIE